MRALRQAAAGCTACPLHRDATQTVFGEGLVRSDVMVIGEVPGDREDLEGHPFVGPAGRVLRHALDLARIEPDRVYTTNVVKHFKFERRGKRRIHQRPNRSEMAACRPWLDAELDVVGPRAILLLGATAVSALVGRDARVTRLRGQVIDSDLAELVSATVHPSSVLRADDREAARAAFEDDVRAFARAVDELTER
jgi:uracil-DNA glycosylase